MVFGCNFLVFCFQFSLVKKLGKVSGKKAPQIAKFANQVSLLKNLVDLGSNTSKDSKITMFANLFPLLNSLGSWILEATHPKAASSAADWKFWKASTSTADWPSSRGTILKSVMASSCSANFPAMTVVPPSKASWTLLNFLAMAQSLPEVLRLSSRLIFQSSVGEDKRPPDRVGKVYHTHCGYSRY